MRVISQDGAIDVPYENFVFGIIEDNSIVAIRDTIARPSEIAQGVVATYSTAEKAKKAMEMLREQYKKYVGASVNIYGCFQFPNNDEIEVQNEA
jgi:hypothetical protein